jgi:uncharacterized damage-inducible protein DinB
MPRMQGLALLIMVLYASSAVAQPSQATSQQASYANPMTRVLQRWWGIAHYIVRAAEAMPEEKYSFKPFADVRSFGEEIGHVADGHYSRCSAVRGEHRPVSAIEGNVTTKETLVAKLKSSVAYCDTLYQTMTDANLAATWQQGRTRGVNLGPLVANIAHDNEHASLIMMLMRMSGIKPPPLD